MHFLTWRIQHVSTVIILSLSRRVVVVTHASFVCAVQDIVVYEKVVAQIGELVLHVSEQSSDICS